MAGLDYGVLKKIDGIFINMNDSEDYLGYKPIRLSDEISVAFYKTNIEFFERGEAKASFWVCDKMDLSDEHCRIESLDIKFKDIKMRVKRLNGSECKFIAKWDINGHHYQVIFGYGIDPNFDTYKSIRKSKCINGHFYSYGYNSKNRRVVDSWFETEHARRNTF